MRIARKLSIGLVGVLLAAAALCQSLPVANRPEEVGMSAQRLERVHVRMQADVESARIPGAVLLIARNGISARQWRSTSPSSRTCVWAWRRPRPNGL